MRQEGGVEAPRIQDISALRIGDQPPIGLQQGLRTPWHHPDTNSRALSLAAPIMARHGASRVRGYNCGRLSFISDSTDTVIRAASPRLGREGGCIPMRLNVPPGGGGIEPPFRRRHPCEAHRRHTPTAASALYVIHTRR
jgi:hypothetical protein